MNKRKDSQANRLKAVEKTLAGIEKNKILNKEIRNLSDLAKKVVDLCGEKIGYSTLLKTGEVYRKHLERTLVSIAPPRPKNARSNGSSFESPQPNNWYHQKLIYESEIGVLKADLEEAKILTQQAKLAIAHASDIGSDIDMASQNMQSEAELAKLCHAVANILDYCAKEDLGIVFDTDAGAISDGFGVKIVNSSKLEPYARWQKKTFAGGGN